MSSILDALKKLEEEKQAAQQAIELDIADVVAQRDLLGTSSYASGSNTSRTVVVAVSSALITVMISAAFIYMLSHMNAGQETPMNSASTQSPPLAPAPISSAKAVSDPLPAANSPTPSTATPPAESSNIHAAQSPAESAVSNPTAQTPQQQPAVQAPFQSPIAVAQTNPPPNITPPPTPPPRPVKPIEVIAPKPIAPSETRAAISAQPKPMEEKPTIGPGAESPLVVAGTAEQKMPDLVRANRPSKLESKDVRALPLLSPDAKTRFGLGNLEINLVGEPNERQPLPFAILNMKQIYVGQQIQSTDARLIGVCTDGIGVEIISTGARFLIPH